MYSCVYSGVVLLVLFVPFDVHGVLCVFSVSVFVCVCLCFFFFVCGRLTGFVQVCVFLWCGLWMCVCVCVCVCVCGCGDGGGGV